MCTSTVTAWHSDQSPSQKYRTEVVEVQEVPAEVTTTTEKQAEDRTSKSVLVKVVNI